MKRKYTGFHWNVTLPLGLSIIMITFIIVAFVYGMPYGKFNFIGWVSLSISAIAAITYKTIFRMISINDERYDDASRQ